MSIYATLWTLQFPKEGDDCFNCDWIEVTAQAVPAHIGSPTPGCGYEKGDPFSAQVQLGSEGKTPPEDPCETRNSL